MSDLKIGKIEFGPLQCSQGGIPYNKKHLDAKDKRIEELEAENERLRAALKHAEEMERCWKANAEALADVANKANSKAYQAQCVLLKCTMNHADAHYIAQAELDRLAAQESDDVQDSTKEKDK